MKIIDVFSKRKKRQQKTLSDIFVYDNIPLKLRMQITHILIDAYGNDTRFGSTQSQFKIIHDSLCREYGFGSLFESVDEMNYASCVLNLIIKTDNFDLLLDTIELSFRQLEYYAEKDFDYRSAQPRISPKDAIDEFNYRFLESGIGYQYESGTLVKVENTFIHKEIIKETFLLLSDKSFKGPNDEFTIAFEHYQNKRYKECINECLKAFESTMKTICKYQHWTFSESDSAGTLINIIKDNGLFPAYMESEFTALKSLLSSGIPPARNIDTSHGQGSEIKNIPSYFAKYILDMTGATIIFLIRAYKDKK